MHVHYLQDEAARVVTGRLGYQVPGEEPKFAGPGELVVWPAGTPHKWWNAGTDALRMAGWCRPPGNIEFFLGALSPRPRPTAARPALFDAAFLMTRYRSRVRDARVAAVGATRGHSDALRRRTVLGKHEKYRDAPEPMTKRAVPAATLRLSLLTSLLQ